MFECRSCAFRLFIPIARVGSSVLALYDDDRFPGRCLLAFEDHVEHFEDLEQDRARSFTEDIQRAARAIRTAVGADRINIAILGNAEPHLHAHLIPRKRLGDPVPTRSPWNHPAEKQRLSDVERASVVSAIAAALTQD